MAIFPSRPLNPSRLNTLIRRQPLLFGAPFVLLMVATSYGLTYFTQTKYDLQVQRVKQVRLSPFPAPASVLTRRRPHTGR